MDSNGSTGVQNMGPKIIMNPIEWPLNPGLQGLVFFETTQIQIMHTPRVAIARCRSKSWLLVVLPLPSRSSRTTWIIEIEFNPSPLMPSIAGLQSPSFRTWHQSIISKIYVAIKIKRQKSNHVDCPKGALLPAIIIVLLSNVFLWQSADLVM